jgi:hypothetical protein
MRNIKINVYTDNRLLLYCHHHRHHCGGGGDDYDKCKRDSCGKEIAWKTKPYMGE